MKKNIHSNRFFYRGINYSACNEDSDSEYGCFKFKGHESVCCILGGGERFFNLLTYGSTGQSFTLVDQNQAQFFIFELKLLAYKNLVQAYLFPSEPLKSFMAWAWLDE